MNFFFILIKLNKILPLRYQMNGISQQHCLGACDGVGGTVKYYSQPCQCPKHKSWCPRMTFALMTLMILDTSADTEEVTISFLHPCSPAPSFVYPRNPDVLVTHCPSVLAKVDPTTATGRTYQLTWCHTASDCHQTNLHSRYVISCTVVHTMWLNQLKLLWIKSLRMSLKTGIFNQTLRTCTSLGDYLYVGSWPSKYISHCYNVV